MVTERDILMYTTYHGCTLHSAVERGGGEGERGGREGREGDNNSFFAMYV